VPSAKPGSDGLCGAVLVAAGVVGVLLIALVDLATGPQLSCSIFYLLPVAACAWWGGFPHAILVALAGSLAWHIVDHIENPHLAHSAAMWNGAVRFSTLTLVSSLVARLHASVLREARLARTDSLTGAANSRTFYEAAGVEAERARRAARPLTLAYLDIDDFKRLNDRLGHVAGDEALRHVVLTIQRNVGRLGLVSRLGGDEFALLLPYLGSEEAVALLARLHGLLLQEMARCGWPVTLSMGAITFLRPALDVDLMVRRIDSLMYGAKRKGKARVEHAVAHDDPQPRDGDRRRAQRRGTARVVCGRTVRVRGEADSQEEFATACDISVTGVGLIMEKALPVGTVVVVDTLPPGAGPLLARVVRVLPEGNRWKHGCSLSRRLNVEELGEWLGIAHEAHTPPPESPPHNLATTRDRQEVPRAP
jgi:diguanylate cyclase (GGDEF)-like protein